MSNPNASNRYSVRTFSFPLVRNLLKFKSCLTTPIVYSIANYRLVSGWSLDNDIDGIPNVVEEQGILATNGHKYYSDPRDRDPDGDGVSDLEEDGVIYVISRSADGRTLTIYLKVW